jgi:YD repeat-containing protein
VRGEIWLSFANITSPVSTRAIPRTARAGLTAAQTRDVYYTYDIMGHQIRARFDSINGEGVTNVYDGFGRLQSHGINMGGAVRTLAYRWDEGSRRTRITHPDGALFGTAYDAPGRPTWLTDPIGSALASFGYDAAGHPNGVGRPGATTGLNFSADGRLLSLSHYIGAPLDVRWTFTHNPASQIAGETRTNDAYAWTGHYAVNRAYTTNGRNQYSAAGSGTFGYDANGNLVTTPGPVAGQTIASRRS